MDSSASSASSAFWLCYYAARLQAAWADGLLASTDRERFTREYAADLVAFADRVATLAALPSDQRTQARALAFAQQAHRFHDGPNPFHIPRYADVPFYGEKGALR